LASGKAAHDKKDYKAAKELYYKAKETMVSLISSYRYSITAEDRAILLCRVAENEFALGNLSGGMDVAKHSVECEETAEVCSMYNVEDVCFVYGEIPPP